MFQKFQAAQAKEAKEKDKKLKEMVMGPAFSPPQLLLELLRLLTGMRASVGGKAAAARLWCKAWDWARA